MRTNIVLNDELVKRGLRLGEASSKRELVELALTEYVQRREAGNLMDLYGAGGIAPGYDYKAARAAGHPASGEYTIQDADRATDPGTDPSADLNTGKNAD